MAKKDKYPRYIVDAILMDFSYYERFFQSLRVTKDNILYLPRKKGNGDHMMLCPFHEERTPSFRVNCKNNAYKCMGCGKSGNVLTLIKEYENISFVKSIKYALNMFYPKMTENVLQYKLNLQLPRDSVPSVSNSDDDDFPF